MSIVGSHTFVPISLLCKKETSVSHGSTESEIISLDARLRMDGLPALDLWNIVMEVLRSTKGNANSNVPSLRETGAKTTKNVDLSNIDQVLVNADSSHGVSSLHIFEDNEAVIKMIINGRRTTMRHISRTHRVALDSLFDRINSDPKIQIKYADTTNQMADMLT